MGYNFWNPIDILYPRRVFEVYPILTVKITEEPNDGHKN